MPMYPVTSVRPNALRDGHVSTGAWSSQNLASICYMKSNSFWILLVIWAATIFATTSNAQYDPYGSDIPTTPDQQDAIDAAVDFLTVVGGEDFAGVSSISAADLNGPLAATSGDGSHIGVDFEALELLLPPGSDADAGAVIISLFHELQHLKGWGRDDCSHAKIIHYTATKHCEYIGWLLATGGSASASCYFYSQLRDIFNRKPAPPGCLDFPGPIPSCGGCPI